MLSETNFSEEDVLAFLGIVLVTSPIRMHPATDLIDSVISSIDLVEPLRRCPLIVVCDGAQVVEDQDTIDGNNACVGKDCHNSDENETNLANGIHCEKQLLGKRMKCENMWRQGRITPKAWDNYVAYTEALKQRYQSRADDHTGDNSKRPVHIVGPLNYHAGFSYALLAGLEELVSMGEHFKTVLVLQHDRIFCRRLTRSSEYGAHGGLEDMVRILHCSKNIQYIGFTSQSTANYLEKHSMRGIFKNQVRCLLGLGKKKDQDIAETGKKDNIISIDPSVDSIGGTDCSESQLMPQHLQNLLTPLFYRYDSAHVARTKEYIHLLKTECKPNQFIESILSPKIEKAVFALYEEKRTYSWMDHYNAIGVFLWNDDNVDPVVRHLDGRRFWTEVQRKEKYGFDNAYKNEVVREVHQSVGAVNKSEVIENL